LNKRAVPAGRQGFTLVEVLAAMGLFLTVFVAFTWLVRSAQGELARTNKLRQATLLLRSQMEVIRQRPEVAPELVVVKLAEEWQKGRPPLVLYTLRSKY
jgi:prepilin-type N-terminal cleavage/methylation domain-containing protein